MPRRKWGQQFLRDDATARRLVAGAGVQPGETVLEVGPGTGRLTRALLEVAEQVLALEVDPRLAAQLAGQVDEPQRLIVVQADAAQADLSQLVERHLGADRRFRAVGNLPYESATAILARLLELGERLTGIAILVQREVAERMISPPGTRTYGYLSVLCQDVAEVRLVQRLRPGAFRPPPRVHSALVTLELRKTPLRGELEARRFHRLVGLLFGQRRKTILNNLQAATPLDRETAEKTLHRAAIDPRARPEDLSVPELAALVGALDE